MDLPPSNSFCRMLTHKLADYYHMTHSFEAVAGSVRIYRTPSAESSSTLEYRGSAIPKHLAHASGATQEDHAAW